MLQNNPLLAQLKQQLQTQTPRIEGIVKGTDKNFGFLESDNQKSHFIPPQQMKKVMAGDKITAALHIENGREIAEPETLLEPALTRFVGRLQQNDKRLFIVPDHPFIKDKIPCYINKSITHPLLNGDWVVAELRRHPLQDKGGFNAEITEFIVHAEDNFAPWYVTLARYKLNRDVSLELPDIDMTQYIESERSDLTHLAFITIDNASTEDMDDALYIERHSDDTLTLFVAIADPSAYLSDNDSLDNLAYEKGFTVYLPGFDIPMLPKALADNLCSLRQNERRPALVCQISISPSGELLTDSVHFVTAWIKSQAKLTYDQVSDWLENTGNWQPDTLPLQQQIELLHHFAILRYQWREQHALIFKERLDYRFLIDGLGNITEIITEPRKIAHRIVEEAMITANLCAAYLLERTLGYGIFNIHAGFDSVKLEQIQTVIQENHLNIDVNELLTLDGFRQLRRLIDQQPTAYLNYRLRRYQHYADMAIESKPHYGLGFESYATWTSPLRKYSDLVNHRLLKAIITHTPTVQPDQKLLQHLAEKRRLYRQVEREISDWLYARYLSDKINTTVFKAELLDVLRGGMRVKLLDNGATAFVPAPLIHQHKKELICDTENGVISIQGIPLYRLGDFLEVVLTEVRLETKSIIARLGTLTNNKI